MWTPGRTVFVVVLLTVAGCDGPTPTEPGPAAQLPTQPSPLPQPGPSSGNAQRFELTGIVTDQEATDAVELARNTGGVVKVVRIFELCRAGDGICRP